MGRPTKYRPEYCDDIIDYMSQGFSKEAYAGKIRVSKHRIYDWMKKYKAFRHAVKQGEVGCQQHWEEIGHDMALAGQGNAAIWIFNMKNRFGWRDRKDVTSDDKALKVDPLVIIKDGDKT